MRMLRIDNLKREMIKIVKKRSSPVHGGTRVLSKNFSKRNACPYCQNSLEKPAFIGKIGINNMGKCCKLWYDNIIGTAVE